MVILKIKNTNEKENFFQEYQKFVSSDSFRDLFEDSEYRGYGGLREGKLQEGTRVTFGGKSFPREGWACILSGGPGSGKGYLLGRHILIDGKVIDVDDLKEWYAKLSKERLDMEYDFSDPRDVAELHRIISNKGWKHDLYNMFFDANDKLYNIIFDITGKSTSSLERYIGKCKDLDYKVSLVWVVTSRTWALFRNLNRERKVPEDIFHSIHNRLKSSIFEFLESSTSASLLDEVWVIFSGDIGMKDFTGEGGLENTAHQIPIQGSKFVIPEKLKRRIIAHLGPNEPDPTDPERYRTYGDVQPEVDMATYYDDEGQQHVDLDRVGGDIPIMN